MIPAGAVRGKLNRQAATVWLCVMSSGAITHDADMAPTSAGVRFGVPSKPARKGAHEAWNARNRESLAGKRLTVVYAPAPDAETGSPDPQ